MEVKLFDYLPRHIEQNVTNDLKRKMIFVSGPRQTGKTTMAKQLCYEAVIFSKS